MIFEKSKAFDTIVCFSLKLLTPNLYVELCKFRNKFIKIDSSQRLSKNVFYWYAKVFIQEIEIYFHTERFSQ